MFKAAKSSYRRELSLKSVNNDPALLEFCHKGNIYEINQKQSIIREGDKANSIFLLLEGSLQVYTTDEKDHELVLSYLTGLNFFGEMGFLEQEKVRSASIKARTEGYIVEMKYEDFEVFCKENPGILLTLCKHMARRLKYTSQQISSMAFDDVQDRVIETIFSLARMPDAMTHPEGIQIRATRQEIGNMLGCSRETVGRVIKSLEEKNVLDTHGKTIIIKVNC